VALYHLAAGLKLLFPPQSASQLLRPCQIQCNNEPSCVPVVVQRLRTHRASLPTREPLVATAVIKTTAALGTSMVQNKTVISNPSHAPLWCRSNWCYTKRRWSLSFPDPSAHNDHCSLLSAMCCRWSRVLSEL